MAGPSVNRLTPSACVSRKLIGKRARHIDQPVDRGIGHRCHKTSLVVFLFVTSQLPVYMRLGQMPSVCSAASCLVSLGCRYM